MLLLTNVLRSRYRGVVHFHPAETDRPPEIEFTDGEGPGQLMNQIQDFAVPEIRKNIEPMGPYLRWEELDLEAGVVLRHRSRFHDHLEFVLCADELGLELVLPASFEMPDDVEQARPWVPLRPLAEPGEKQRGSIGWSVEQPELKWRYLQTRYAPPAIELTWSCPSLPAHWAARVLSRARQLDCHLGDDQPCPLNATRDGLLVYRGFFALADGSPRPARLPVRLEQPLVVVTGAEQAAHELEDQLPATVDALDFRAVIGDRPTRLVAGADLDRRFAAEVWTAEDVLLPDVIPAGEIPGLPWDLETVPEEIQETRPEANPSEATGQRRWRLAPRSQASESRDGSWREVEWRHDPAALEFGLGAFDPSKAPRITRIENRRASVTWRIEAEDRGGTMCLCVPHWVPVGCPGQVALPARDNGFDYGAEVRASLEGLDERFVIDQSSEIPFNRLFLDPRRWRFHDQVSGAITDGEALGEGAGCVRWRRATDESSDSELKPTDWAAGSAPVLLLRRDEQDTHAWGGLYAPGAVPWGALEKVPAEPTSSPEEILFVPRACAPDRPSAIWIDLWGFVCRYDVHRLAFSRSHGQRSEPTAWIASPGLELFPERDGHLLRSFAPIYAVLDPEPRRFSLRPTSPRPTLHVGRELGEAAESQRLVLDVGPETYLRCQLVDRGQVPRVFEPGRVPGTRLCLDRVGRSVAWLAIEQRRDEQARRAGYLLSWDAAGGWRFRGFFAHRGAAVELGAVSQRDLYRRIFLGGEGASRVSTFRLTIDRQGDHWSETTPAAARETTVESIRAWEIDHFAPGSRPAPLQAYGMYIRQQAAADQPWIFEFFDRASRADDQLPPGIRVWELHGDADEELAEQARELAEDPPAEPQTRPKKRILRADDDDDF